MRRLATALLLASALPLVMSAQQRDPSLQRIRLALEQASIAGGATTPEPPQPPRPLTVGPFVLVPPASRGEIVRVMLPVGDLVSRGAKAIAARQRRQHAAAKRDVAAAVKLFAEQHPLPE